MRESRKLPSGITLIDGLYRFDFNYNGKRCRLRTIYTKKDKLVVVEKLYNSLICSLDEGRFKPSFFIDRIPNIEVLGEMKDKYNISDLLSVQLERYRSRQDLTLPSIINLDVVTKIHLIPYFKNINITTITVYDIEEFIKQIKLSRDRIKLILRPLRHVFKFAVRENIIKEDPFEKLDANILSQHSVNTEYEVRPFNQDEIQLILKSCSYDTVRNLISTGFYTGMRISELFALTWSDVDFDNEQIHVNKSVDMHGLIKLPKTKAGIRNIEMIELAKEALMAQFKITGNAEDERVFKTPRGKNYLRTDGFGRYWREALIKSGVEYRNPYQMRHTFISYMLMRGNSPLVLYRMVGHETPEIIYKFYARFIAAVKGKKILI